METGLFEIQAAHLRDYRRNRPLLPGFSSRYSWGVPASRFWIAASRKKEAAIVVSAISTNRWLASAMNTKFRGEPDRSLLR
jgi:hypothetical protein